MIYFIVFFDLLKPLAEYCLRVARRMSLIVRSDAVCRLCDFCLIFVPFDHYDEDVKTSAIQIVQGLIEKVVLTPNPKAENRLEAMIYGDLARILRSSSNEELPASFLEAGSQLSLVAGVGFHLFDFPRRAGTSVPLSRSEVFV